MISILNKGKRNHYTLKLLMSFIRAIGIKYKVYEKKILFRRIATIATKSLRKVMEINLYKIK